MKKDRHGLTEYLQNLQSEGQYWFIQSETIKALDISTSAFRKAIHNLTFMKKVKRIRNEFFVTIPSEYQFADCIPASWFIDAFMKYCKAEYYVALGSAVVMYGLVQHEPLLFEVVVNQRIQSKITSRFNIKYYYKKTIKRTFSQPMESTAGNFQVSTPEMTLFDMIRRMSTPLKIHYLASAIHKLSEHIQHERLIMHIKNSDVEIATIQRTGYLLELLNLSYDLSALQKVIEDHQPMYRPLVIKSNTKIFGINRRWKILVNEIVKLYE